MGVVVINVWMMKSKRITNPDNNKCRIANPTQRTQRTTTGTSTTTGVTNVGKNGVEDSDRVDFHSLSSTACSNLSINSSTVCSRSLGVASTCGVLWCASTFRKGFVLVLFMDETVSIFVVIYKCKSTIYNWIGKLIFASFFWTTPRLALGGYLCLKHEHPVPRPFFYSPSSALFHLFISDFVLIF